MANTPDKLTIEHKPATWGFCAALLLAAAGMVAANAGWKATQEARQLVWKSESNYFSALARVEAAQQAGRKPLLFLGSSRTGRIAGAESADLPWNAVGIDGSSAAEGLSLLLNGTLSSADVAAVEMNNFFEDIPPVLTDAAQGSPLRPAFTRAAHRTAALLYSELRGQHADTTPPTLQAELAPLPHGNKPQGWTAHDEARLQLLCRVQRACGVRMLPLLLPCPNGQTDNGTAAKAAYAAAVLQAPLLDLNGLQQPIHITFTDNTHMSNDSALRTAWAVYQWVQQH